MDSEHIVEVHAVPQVNVQLVEGAGERSMHRTEFADVKDGEYSVCFERMGMGDLEVVDVVDVAGEVVQVSARGQTQTPASGARAMPHVGVPQEAWQPAATSAAPAPPSVSYCYLEWTPSEDSDDEDVGLLDALDVQQPEVSPRDEHQDPQCSRSSRMLHASQNSKCSQTVEESFSRALTSGSSAVLTRSKLGITNVSVISLPSPESRPQLLAQAEMTWEQKLGQYDDVDVEDDAILDDEEDEVSRRAPTPDNTPEHTPSEEHQHGLGMGVELGHRSTLYSTLKDMALLEGSMLEDEPYSGSSTPTPEVTPEGSGMVGRPGSGQEQGQGQATSGGGGALGRVWSRLLGRTSRTRADTVPSSPPTLKHQEDTEDSDDADYEDRVVEVDPQTIDELEATLEEVRLDGDADDPVVSYLVEEVEDAVRAPGTTSRDVTVEEVHDDAADEELPPPAPRPSGLLSRLFSKTSRTSQDVTTSEPVRRGRGSSAAKKGGKSEAPSRDRALHLHRFKPRQTNKAALRSSMPRCLARWLRQGQGEGGGAEGDAGYAGNAGESVGLRALRPPRPPASGLGPLGRGQRGQPAQPPALQRTRRSLNHAGHEPSIAVVNPQVEDLQDDGHCSVKKSKEEKLLANFGSQTDAGIEDPLLLVHIKS